MLTKTDLESIKTIIDTALKPLKKEISKVRRDLKTYSKFFDGEHIRLEKRVEFLEGHRDHPPVSSSS